MDFGFGFGRPEVTIRTGSVTGSVTLIPAALPLALDPCLIYDTCFIRQRNGGRQRNSKGEQSRYSNHPRAHTVILGWLTTRKKFPPPLATRQARSYHAIWATQTLLFSKPSDLSQVCHGNNISIGISSTLHIELKVEWNF